MSGAGSPHIVSDATGIKVTIIAGLWHETITNGLIAGARRALAAAIATAVLLRRLRGEIAPHS